MCGMMVAGLNLVANSRVQKKLNFTDEQKNKVKDMAEESMKAMAEAREEFQGDREGMMKKMTEMQAEMTKKAADLLTDDQKKTWKEMVGEPFTIVREPRPGGPN